MPKVTQFLRSLAVLALGGWGCAHSQTQAPQGLEPQGTLSAQARNAVYLAMENRFTVFQEAPVLVLCQEVLPMDEAEFAQLQLRLKSYVSSLRRESDCRAHTVLMSVWKRPTSSISLEKIVIESDSLMLHLIASKHLYAWREVVTVTREKRPVVQGFQVFGVTIP